MIVDQCIFCSMQIRQLQKTPGHNLTQSREKIYEDRTYEQNGVTSELDQVSLWLSSEPGKYVSV